MLTELVELPGGSFRMGSTRFYPEEAPIHTVQVAGFAMERHPITNAQFAEFVDDSGYVTVAERELDPALYPGANPTTNTRRSFLGKHTERPSNTGRLGHFPHPSWYQSRWEGCDAFCPQFRTDTWPLHPLTLGAESF